MVLIDTSAWIQFFRKKGNPELKNTVARLLQIQQAAYTCPVYYELYFGAKSHEIEDLELGLSFAQRYPVNVDHWDQAARTANQLRLKGFSVPASDILIATVASDEELSLLSNDKHFVTVKENAMNSLQLQF